MLTMKIEGTYTFPLTLQSILAARKMATGGFFHGSMHQKKPNNVTIFSTAKSVCSPFFLFHGGMKKDF